jgi:O-antigen/teichoic acid export membrane protein
MRDMVDQALPAAVASAQPVVEGPLPSGRRSVRAGSLMLVSNLVQLIVSAGTFAVLARLLIPSDFGVFAMAVVLVGMVATFRDFGLHAAILQQSQIRHAEVSALFWLNLRRNLILSLIMVAAAPILAWFFREPAVLMIAVAVTAGGLVASVSVLHHALLGREMRFGAVTAMEISAATVGGLVGIGAAVFGAGVWALVLQMVTMFVVHGTLPWLLCSWRPLGYRQSAAAGAEVGTLLSYGKSLSLSRVVVWAGQNFGFVVVGRVAGAGALGLYQAAFRWATLPVHQVYRPLDQVVVSSLRPLRSDTVRYCAAMRSAIRATATLVLPTIAFLGVCASDIVLLLLGPQWSGAVGMFRVLALAAFLDVARLSTKWIHLIEGRTDRQLRLALLSTPVLAVGSGVGVAWGALGAAVGFAAAVGVLVYPTVVYGLASSPLTVRDFWRALARPAASALLAAAVTAAALPALTGLPLLLRLALAAALFVVACAAAWLAVPGGARALGEVMALARLLRGGPATAENGAG